MLLLALLVGILVRTAPARMPQALAGGDFLSVLLGDAKKDISGAMLREADSYFHGGIDMDCSVLHEHGHDHDHDHEHVHDHDHDHDHNDGHDRNHDHEHEHEHDDDHDHEHETEKVKQDQAAFDPWRWINSHIRAPEIERHLAGRKTVEMMPWFWVSIKADPHNVKAWSAAWYTALHMMKDESLAMQIAVEGQRLNPESLEMANVLGRTYRAESTRDPKKSEAMFRAAVEMAGRKEELEDSDYIAFFSSVGYLADAAKNRKDAKDLLALLKAARRINPHHPTARFIEQALGIQHAAPSAQPSDHEL